MRHVFPKQSATFGLRKCHIITIAIMVSSLSDSKFYDVFNVFQVFLRDCEARMWQMTMEERSTNNDLISI